MNLLEVKKIRTKCSGIIEALWRWWQIEWISKYKGAFWSSCGIVHFTAKIQRQ
jgi:hypothetical protein